jgi:protein Hikeshi
MTGLEKDFNFWECNKFLILSLSYRSSNQPRLSNEKPSAIFRLRTPQSFVYSDSTSASFASQAQGQEDQKAFLGLSLEPMHLLLSLPTSTPTASTISNAPSNSGAGPANSVVIATSLAPLIAQNLFSYLSSFSSSLPIPEEIIKKWYENFVSRVSRSGVGFLERSGNE